MKFRLSVISSHVARDGGIRDGGVRRRLRSGVLLTSAALGTAALALAVLPRPSLAQTSAAAGERQPAASGRLSVPGASASWQVVRPPKLAANNTLNGLAVVSSRLAWAAGAEGWSSDGSNNGRPLLLRWNGNTWSKVSLPAAWRGGITAVASSSATSAWALGMNSQDTKIAHLLHWAGSGWHSMTMPAVSASIEADINLAAAPGGRAWISLDGSANSSSLYAWNGQKWAAQSYPCAQWACGIVALGARASTDAWAVGNYVTSSGTGGPMAMHWTGSGWQQTTVPYVKDGYLTGVYAASATNAWAVGAVFQTSAMLLYHWNGTTWKQVPTPAGLTPPPAGDYARVTGDGASRIWLYGFGTSASGQAHYLRYDGHSWSMISDALTPSLGEVIVRGFAAVPGTRVMWSVGIGLTTAQRAGRARIERYLP